MIAKIWEKDEAPRSPGGTGYLSGIAP